jgi:hypothetical protein
MKTLKTFILENTQKTSIPVYRGLSQKFDPKYKNDVLWVSTSLDHAEMYASQGKGEILRYTLNGSKLKPLDLGFRSVETEVKFDEIIGRLKPAIMEQFQNGNLSRNTAMEVMEDIDALKSLSGYKQVWEWIHVKDVLELLKKAGFNAIKQNEDLVRGGGKIVTYGIIQNASSLLKSV